MQLKEQVMDPQRVEDSLQSDDGYIVLDSCSELSDTDATTTAGGVRPAAKRNRKFKQQQQHPAARRQAAALKKIRALKFKAKVTRDVMMVRNKNLVIRAKPVNRVSGTSYRCAPGQSVPPLFSPSAMNYGTRSMFQGTHYDTTREQCPVGEHFNYNTVSNSSVMPTDLRTDLRPLIKRRENESAQNHLYAPRRDLEGQYEYGLPESRSANIDSSYEHSTRLSSLTSGLQTDSYHSSNTHGLPARLVLSHPGSPHRTALDSHTIPSSSSSFSPAAALKPERLPEHRAVYPPTWPATVTRNRRKRKRKVNVQQPTLQATIEHKTAPHPWGSLSSALSLPVSSSAGTPQSHSFQEAAGDVATQIRRLLPRPPLQSTPVGPSARYEETSMAQLLARIDAGISSFIAASKEISDCVDHLKTLSNS